MHVHQLPQTLLNILPVEIWLKIQKINDSIWEKKKKNNN
jgi:hypothetical protein